MRFVLAAARVQSLATALGLALALALARSLLGGHLLSVPFLQEAVEAGRVFPAPLAACGTLVVSDEWARYEQVGVRSRAALLVVRWVAGGTTALLAAYLAGAAVDVVAGLFGLLTLLATLLPRHWWLALPPLLYLQLYLPPGFLLQ